MISEDFLGSIQFDKMQSLGNDFVLIDRKEFQNIMSLKPAFLDFVNTDIGRENFLFEDSFEDRNLNKTSENSILVKFLCNRRFGIGCDQLVIYSYEDGQLEACFFNNDGSQAEICGNAARALGLLMNKKYKALNIKLIANSKNYQIHFENENEISVNMGYFSLDPKDLYLSHNVKDIINLTFEDLKLRVQDYTFLRNIKFKAISCISVGNPHIIFFMDKQLPYEACNLLGRVVKSNELFENEINVGFAKINSINTEISLIVFERGAGLTLSCGSGACAAAALAHLNGFLIGKNILVKQRGGNIIVTINADGTYMQKGSSKYVFSGKL